MAQQIQFRRGTAALWTSVNPTLAEGECGLETDTGKLKVGNGTQNWVNLPYPLSSTTRSDYVTSPTPYIYIGRAPTGTPEATASWTIKRSETNSQGTILNTLTAVGAWTNRYSLTYT